MNIKKTLLFFLFWALIFSPGICKAELPFENHFQIKLRFDFLSFQETYPEHIKNDYHQTKPAPLEFFYTSLFFRYGLSTPDVHFNIAFSAASLWEDSSSLDLDNEGKLGKKISLYELFLFVPGTDNQLQIGRFFFDPLPRLKENNFFKGTLDGLHFKILFSPQSELSLVFDVLQQDVQVEETYSYSHLASPDAPLPLQNSLTYRTGFSLSISELQLLSFLTHYPPQASYSELSLPQGNSAENLSQLYFYFGGLALDLPSTWFTLQLGFFPSIIFKDEGAQSFSKKGAALQSHFIIKPAPVIQIDALFLYQSKHFSSFAAPSPGGLIARSLLGIKLRPEAAFYGLESPADFDTSPKNFTQISFSYFNNPFILLLQCASYMESTSFHPLFYEIKSRLHYLWKPSLRLSLESAYLYPAKFMIKSINSPGWAFNFRLEFFFKN